MERPYSYRSNPLPWNRKSWKLPHLFLTISEFTSSYFWFPGGNGRKRHLAVPWYIFVCGHWPKTKELLELFLFTIWFISSFKRNSSEKNSPGPGIKLGYCWPAKHSINWAPATLLNHESKIIDLNLEFQKPRRRPWTSPGLALITRK